MAKHGLVVYGAGGHGKVIADALRVGGRPVDGFIDDGIPVGTAVLGLRVLGGIDWVIEAVGTGAVDVALGVGDNRVRRKIAARCQEIGARLVTVVHPRAVVSPAATVGEGAVVLALAVVNPDAVIGRGAIVNTAAIVEHDVVLGDWSHLSSNAAMGGGASLGEEAHAGVGASLLPFATVGARAIVGAGAVVKGAIPEGAVAWGVPARVHR